ncbi:2OG-Fe(II) oxygenase family protein [Amycolatopsis halotolerans]|uniref:2OG-Fe(II) oxygenase family protein n=1 Tax=Amycolatopsis halotolerans TaxID=330083 RepID=A0ABV7QBA1_9PSEU
MTRGDWAMTTSVVPLLDLHDAPARFREQLLAGASWGAAELAGAEQCRELARRTELAASEFFAGDESEKAASVSPSGHRNRGWTSAADDDGRPVYDRLSIARFDDAAAASAGGVPAEYTGLYEHPNVWPSPELKALTERFRDSVVRTCEQLLARISEALGVKPDDLFAGAPDNTNITLTEYHPRTGLPAGDGNPLSFPEHKDRSLLSLLSESGEPGRLQIESLTGEWLTCRPDPARFVVLFGLTAEKRTGGLLRAGNHRVLPPRTGRRRSTSNFYFPHLATPTGSLFGEVAAERETVGQVLLAARGRSL